MEQNSNLVEVEYKSPLSFKEGKCFPKGSGFGGMYYKLPEEVYKKLREPMPPESIKPHPTKTYLSTVKAIYITERLNNIFGIGGWDLEHTITDLTKNGDKPYVVMQGRIYFREYDLYTPFQFGGHEIEGKGTEPADGYKSAVTDIQSKCASLVEIAINVFKGLKDAPKTKPEPKKDTVTHIPVAKEETLPVKEEKKYDSGKTKTRVEMAEEETAKKDEDMPMLNPVFKEATNKYMSIVDREEFKIESIKIVAEAEAAGLPPKLVATLKQDMKLHYKTL